MNVNQPMGRVVKLEYRDKAPKMAADTSAFVVHIRGPDGEMHEHPLQNPEWMIHNVTLQFMAVNGFKPTDIDGTSMNVEDWQWLVPVSPDGDGGYLLAQHVLEGGVKALQDAEWFASSDDSDDADSDDSGPNGGGGPDPGTGNRAGVNHDEEVEDTGVTAELTPDENTGVQVTVE